MSTRKPTVAKRVFRQKTIQVIQGKLNQLGNKINCDAERFLNFRLLSSCLVLIVSIFCFDKWYLYAPILTLGYYYILPKLAIDQQLRQRARKLEYEAMLYFEVLTLALESGKNLKQALEITTSSIHSELSVEFQNTLSEIKYGKGMVEALHDLRKRIPSNMIQNVILNMIECYHSGGNFVQNLRRQVEYIRDMKLLRSKEKINRMPIQISVISVIFFIPMILLLILAPVVIQYFVS